MQTKKTYGVSQFGNACGVRFVCSSPFPKKFQLSILKISNSSGLVTISLLLAKKKKNNPQPLRVEGYPLRLVVVSACAHIATNASSVIIFTLIAIWIRCESTSTFSHCLAPLCGYSLQPHT
jgi:hypothetical protein